MCNLNVMGWFAFFGGEGGGTSSSSLRAMCSRTDSSPDDTCESSAKANLLFGRVGAVCSSCGVFGVGFCLRARYGASISSSSSVSLSSSLSSLALRRGGLILSWSHCNSHSFLGWDFDRGKFFSLHLVRGHFLLVLVFLRVAVLFSFVGH